MRKKFWAFLLMLLFLPCICFADPIIKSDSRTFDVVHGVYNLEGNVFVQFPVKNSTMTITGDSTQVYMFQMEVHGQGNITLAFDDMAFCCNKVDVYGKEKTAYMEGNMQLEMTDLSITSDSGNYCWGNKIATFNGNVKVNGHPRPDNTRYNMETKQFLE